MRKAMTPAALRSFTGGGRYDRLVMLAIAVFVTAWVGIVLTRETESIALLWLSNAITLTFLLRSPQSTWAALVITAAIAIHAANVSQGTSQVASLGFVFCNTVEVLVAAILIRRLSPERPIDITRPRTLAAFALGGVVLGPAAAALLAAPIFAALSDADPLSILRTWFLADALGMLVLGPLILSVSRSHFSALRTHSRAETIVILGATAATAAVVFSQSSYPLLFLAPLPLILAGFRLGFAGSAISACIATVIVVGFTLAGFGPLMLVDDAIETRVFLIQTFLAVMVFQTLAVATAITLRDREAERRAAAETRLKDANDALRRNEDELLAAKSALEQRVAHRTAALAATNQRLTEAVEELTALVDSAPIGVVTTDPGGAVTLWNPAAEQIFGYTKQEAMQSHPPTLPADLRELWLRHLREDPSGSVTAELEVECPRKDGITVEAKARLTRLFDNAGDVRGVLAIIEDVSERNRVEEQLRQSQKMDAIGQLTGGVAHDFNNILTVITGMTESLATGVADRPRLAAAARMIDEAATRGAELTRQLLAFARKQPLEPRPTDVNALVVETARLLRPTLGEHIEIESMLADDVGQVMIDPNQLSAALLNLAVNARDAMPQGGKLTLETGIVALDEAYAQANREVVPGSYAMIAVSDTGAGIPASIQDKVFEPFFTTKHPGKGTGLGLSMVYGFVKQSGGHIKVYSEVGHGTAVKLYLPRADAQDVEAAGVAAPGATPGGNETILVVEDDELVRGYVVALLESLGYEVLSASSGTEALAVIDGNTPVDLLFTDVVMPGGMNGAQLAVEARRRRPEVKVLYTSGYTENAIVHHGRLDRGAALLNKPYRKADLAAKIREVLARAPRPTPS